MSNWLGLPPNVAANGGEIDQIISIIHVLMIVLFIGWGAFFVFVLYRFRASKNPKANYQNVKGKTAKYVEITVAGIEALLLIGFSIPIWAKRVDQFPPQDKSTVVRVVAQQFAWNVHYPGADGVFGRTDVNLVDEAINPVGLDKSDPAAKDDITTINQLYLPKDKPAIVHLSSKDVIHSFGVPLMRVKQDAIPGMAIPFWFEPVEEGEYEIVCSQLCGNSHYRMRGFIQVKSQEDYDKWMSEQALAAAEDSGGEDDFWN